MAITIEKLDGSGDSYAPARIITLSPVQRIEMREVFQPVLADTAVQRAADTFDPDFIHDYLKGRRNFAIHERVHEDEDGGAFTKAQDRMEFFTNKDYKSTFILTWGDYSWTVAITSARIIKVPAEPIYDFFLDLVGVR